MKQLGLLLLVLSVTFLSCKKLEENSPSRQNNDKQLKSLDIPWTYSEIETYDFDTSFLKEEFVDFYDNLVDYEEDERVELEDYSIFETVIFAEATVNHRDANWLCNYIIDTVDTLQLEIQTETIVNDTPFYNGNDVADEIFNLESSLSTLVGEASIIIIDFEIEDIEETYITLRAIVHWSANSIGLVEGSFGNPTPFPQNYCTKSIKPGPCNGSFTPPPYGAPTEIERRLNPCQLQTGPPSNWCSVNASIFGITYNGYSYLNSNYSYYLWGGNSPNISMYTSTLNDFLDKGEELFNDHGYHGVGPNNNWYTFFMNYYGFSHSWANPEHGWLCEMHYGYFVTCFN